MPLSLFNGMGCLLIWQVSKVSHLCQSVLQSKTVIRSHLPCGLISMHAQTLEACHNRRQPMPLNRDRGMLPAAYDQLMRVTWGHVAITALFLVWGFLALQYMYIVGPSQHSLFIVAVVCTFLYHSVWSPFVMCTVYKRACTVCSYSVHWWW